MGHVCLVAFGNHLTVVRVACCTRVSLTKQIKLTQTLIKLFIKYQVTPLYIYLHLVVLGARHYCR